MKLMLQSLTGPLAKIACATVLGVTLFASPQPAQAAHVSVGIGIGGGGYYGGGPGYYGGGPGYYGHGYYGRGYYPGYYPGYYYDVAPPPTVVYAPPPPTVVYQQAPVQYVSPNVIARQTSPTYTDEDGQTCREYQSTAVVDGARQQIYGTACLQPDGAWRIVR